jgi:hypothetical protein
MRAYRGARPQPGVSQQVRGWIAGTAPGGKLGFHGSLAGLAAPATFAPMLRGRFGSDWVVVKRIEQNIAPVLCGAGTRATISGRLLGGA